MQLVIAPDAGSLAQLQAWFDRLRQAGRSTRRPLMQIGLFVRREAQRRLRGRSRDWGLSTGRLAKTLAMEASELGVRVGSALPYAAIQQFGGRVVPKTVRYLAIPVLSHLRRSGTWPRDLPRGSMKFSRVEDIGIGNRRWRGPALVRAQAEVGGPEAGARRRRAKGGSSGPARREIGEVMFALVKSVSIHGRPYLAFGPAEQGFALKALDAHWRAAGGG